VTAQRGEGLLKGKRKRRETKTTRKENRRQRSRQPSRELKKDWKESVGGRNKGGGTRLIEQRRELREKGHWLTTSDSTKWGEVPPTNTSSCKLRNVSGR